MRFFELLIRPIKLIAEKLEDSYTGSLGIMAHTLTVVGILALVSSPLIVYMTLLSLRLQVPYSYISITLWFGFIAIVLVGDGYIIYAQEKKYLEDICNGFKWDIEEYSKEYLELLEKQRAKRKNMKK